LISTRSARFLLRLRYDSDPDTIDHTIFVSDLTCHCSPLNLSKTSTAIQFLRTALGILYRPTSKHRPSFTKPEELSAMIANAFVKRRGRKRFDQRTVQAISPLMIEI
jgi:hypothetical protein